MPRHIQTGSVAGGDLSGAFPSPSVTKINGVAVTGTPIAGQTITATGATTAAWATSSGGGGTVSDATSVAKGIVQLAGDLAGTAAAPTVPALATKYTTLTPTSSKTSVYIASVGDFVLADVSSGTFTVTLPTSPTDKSTVAIKKTDTTTNIVTISTGGTDVFYVSGATTTSLTLPGQAITLQYTSGSPGKWIGISNDVNAASLVSPTSTVFPSINALSTTADVGITAKTTGTNKGAFVTVDATSDTNHGVQGAVSSSVKWLLGRAGDNAYLVYMYTNYVKAMAWDSSQNTVMYGDLKWQTTGTYGIVAPTTGTGSGLQIGTATAQRLSFYGNTPIIRPTGSLLAAIASLGLVSSPTIAQSDVTNLTADLAAIAPPVTTKGDLYGFSASTTRVPVGANGQVLTADSTQTTGLKWSTVTGTGTVTSVDISGGTTGLTSSGGPVTGSGTITLAGTLAVANGGTGSATQNFVDLTTAQSSIGGAKTFTSTITFSTGFVVSGSTALNGSIRAVQTSRTAAVTLATSSARYNRCTAASANYAITLPAASGSSGQQFTFKKVDNTAFTITVTAAGSDTIDGASTYVLATQYKYLTIINNGSTAWDIVANN